MDLASAVQVLLAYEASLKLAPGQKPPPPSTALFAQISSAEEFLDAELTSKPPQLQLPGLPPSVWSDWPLCCGVNLTPKELKAARSLSPYLLRERGLLGLFLALHSCAVGRVGRSASLGPNTLVTLARLYNSKENDPAPFPSVHLAARVGHRLINADDTLDFQVGVLGADVWNDCHLMAISILEKKSSALTALPHKAAGLSLAKEMAVMLDALCAAQRDLRGIEAIRGGDLSNRFPLLMACNLLCWAKDLLVSDEVAAEGKRVPWSLRKEMYNEAAALPAYDPLLLLQSFDRRINSQDGLNIERRSVFFNNCRFILWSSLVYHGSVSKLRPADGYTAMRLGLEDLGSQGPVDDGWSTEFVDFALDALQSGLVQPELILRARPQLLEGLVEGLTMGRFRGKYLQHDALVMVDLLTHSPAVGFHLRKFFSRSGCLHFVREISNPGDGRKALIRLLGPRAAQSDAKPWLDVPALLELIAEGKKQFKDMFTSFGLIRQSPTPTLACDFIIRDLTLDDLREPSHARAILQYLSELAEEIAAPRRPNAQYGVLMVAEIGKACLALSSIVTRALKDIREKGPTGKGSRGPGGVRASRASTSQQAWRARLADMGMELSLLRRRVLHELLPLAEAREAALWEGVSDEEVMGALKGDA